MNSASVYGPGSGHLSQGHIVQGTHHPGGTYRPRKEVRGHFGRGDIVMAQVEKGFL